MPESAAARAQDRTTSSPARVRCILTPGRSLPGNNGPMPSPNYFSSASLDRAGHLRRDPEWLRAQLAHPETRLVVVRASEVVVDSDRRLAFVPDLAPGLDHAEEGVVFLG